MILPSNIGGRVTEQVGYLRATPEVVAPWLHEGFGAEWSLEHVEWKGLRDAVEALKWTPQRTRCALVPSGGWTLLLTNGPLGTDVGLIPSLAARELGCRALRAVCAENGDGEFPARILELFGPDGAGPLLRRRSIAASNDGGRWIFETAGEPLTFEDTRLYESRRKSDRFPSTALYAYLRQLGVPIDIEPDWAGTQLLELTAVQT